MIEFLTTQRGPAPPPPPTALGIQNWLILAFALILYGVGYLVIAMIDRGRIFGIRRLPALDAIDQAIGRVTEMGSFRMVATECIMEQGQRNHKKCGKSLGLPSKLSL